MNYYLQDEEKNITVHAAWRFDKLCIETQEDIVKGYDNKYYLASNAPKIPLVELKNKKLVDISAWTSLAITGGCISNCTGYEVRYDSDVDTQLTMQGIAIDITTEEFLQQYPAGCPVRGYKKLADSFETEKTIQYLNPEQVLLFCADLSKHIGAQKQRGWELQEVVKVAETKEELAQIIW